MNRKFILAGIGGQGVVYATKVLSQAALLRGDQVLASENHGMSQRGGSVMAHVKIGESVAPLIRRGTADAVLAFDRAEAMRNLPYLRAGGDVFVNSPDGLDSVLNQPLAALNIAVHALNAQALAQTELGVATSANVVLLGFAAAHADFGLSLADLQNAVRALGPAKAVEMNLRALELGARAVNSEQ